MVYMKAISMIIAGLFIFTSTQSQKNWQKYFDQKYNGLCGSGTTFRENFLLKSTSGNVYDFMGLSETADALMNMYVATENEEYLNDEIKLINNVIATANVSKLIPENEYVLKDDYLGWTSKTPGHAFNNETVVAEGYLFRYIVQFLYEIKKTGWKDRSVANSDWYHGTLQFVEKNLWEKWISRSLRSKARPYGTFLSSRTHMGSLWAFTGLILKEITDKPEIKTQCQELVDMYDLLLKRNLKPNPDFPNAYVWNSTWDSVDGTQAEPTLLSSIQDVSHGNHVTAYLALSKRLNNPNWTDEDIMKVCNTIKQVVYNKNKMTFSDNVDGSPSEDRPGWGNSQADGWLKLALFDQHTLNLYLNFALQREDLVMQYGPELQYYADLTLIEYLLPE